MSRRLRPGLGGAGISIRFPEVQSLTTWFDIRQSGSVFLLTFTWKPNNRFNRTPSLFSILHFLALQFKSSFLKNLQKPMKIIQTESKIEKYYSVHFMNCQYITNFMDYGTWKFNVAFTRAPQWTLSWAESTSSLYWYLSLYDPFK